MDRRSRSLAMAFLIAMGNLSPAFPGEAAPPKTMILRDETKVETKSLAFDGEELRIDGDRRIHRNLVNELYFVDPGLSRSETGAAKEAERVTAEEALRLKGWYARSEELQKRHPGSNGIILLDRADYRRGKDGKTTRRYSGRVHCLTDAHVKQYTRFVGWMEEGRSRWTFHDVTVYQRDGTVYRFDPSRVRTVEQQDQARFFTRGKLAVYPVEGMAVDAIVDFSYSSEQYNPFRKDFFFPAWGFQSEEPTALSRLTFDLPPDEPFYYSLYNVGVHAPIVAELSTKERKRLEFSLSDVPPFIKESQSVQYADVAPYFRGSLFQGWKPIFDFLYELDSKHVKVTPEIQRFTDELVKGCKTETDKVAKIYHWLQEKIRYIAIKMGVASGWGGYPAEVTFKKQFGCCIDKALLFTAMLSSQKIWSTPIVLMTNSEADVKWNLPQIGFNHAISKVRCDGKEMILDSTNSDFRFPSHAGGNHGVKVISVFERKIVDSPTPTPKDNGAVYRTRMTLKADGDLDVSWQPSYSGNYEAMLRGYYKRVKEDNRRRVMESIIGREHPGAKLRSFAFANLYDLSKPFSFTLDYVMPDYCKKAGRLRIFDVPSLEMDFEEIALKKREFPMEYGTSYQKKRIYDLQVPTNLRLKFLPESLKLSDPHATFELRFEKLGPQKLRIVSDFQRHARIVAPGDYAAYRDFLNRVMAASQKKIFFETLSRPTKGR